MRKRNRILFILTILFIAVSAIIFCASFLIVWGRVLAPSMPNSFITKLWRLVKETCFAKWFMNTLRQSNLYDAFCYAARDSDGSLSPVIYLFGLMGSVSFLLGTVNEIKSTRSRGMMMNDVIRYIFPCHLIIQAPLYALLATLGWYACLKNVGFSAMFCLVGTFLCFVYSLTMAFCLLVSPKTRDWLVIYFISKEMADCALDAAKGKIERDKLEPNKKVEWQREAGAYVLNYAKYIGQQWSSGTMLQTFENNYQNQEQLLVKLAAWGLSAKVQSFDNENTPITIAHSFNRIFPDATQYGVRGSEYVLFKKALHFTSDKHITAFRQDVLRCSKIWEQLFEPIECNNRKAHLAYIVLREAQISNWHILALLSFGLLEYLGVAQLSNATQEVVQTIKSKIGFLLDIQQAATNTLPEEHSKTPSDFTDIWSEIIYVTASIVQWMVSLNHIPREAEDSILAPLLRTSVRHGVSDSGKLHLILNKDKYIVFAYLLFSCKNLDVHKSLSVYALLRLLPIVSQKLTIE